MTQDNEFIVSDTIYEWNNDREHNIDLYGYFA